MPRRVRVPDSQSLILCVSQLTTTPQVYFVAHGTVQGVGFRYFTRAEAQKHSVVGWCRNTPDNTVEGEAQAPHDSLTSFLDALHRGPRHARVERVSVQDREVVSGEKAFEIRR
ncbi:hypothetical protein E4U54_005421 [Claviceps lovelessii]|nr:hypothetical protein E4U54_005421 [Claviceps lovelessii]